MSENQQQAPLNGEYYGPSIPPSESNQRSSRECRSCLLIVLLKIVVAIVILTGLAMLILYLIYMPQNFKVTVTNATLTEFNLANTTTTTTHPNIHYNLDLSLTVKNPNKKFGVYYEKMEARVYYKNKRFTAKNMDNFFLKKKGEKNHKLNLKGQSLLVLGSSGLKEFNKDMAGGVYKINLKFRPDVRYKLGDFIFGRKYPKVNCGLKVPLKSSNGSMVSAFKTTKCSIRLKALIP